MIKKLKSITLSTALGLFAFAAPMGVYAEDAITYNDNEINEVIKEIEDKFNYKGIVSYITESDNKGSYFVVLSDGSNTYYTKGSDNMVVGDIFNIKTKKNVSESLKGGYNLKVLEAFEDSEKIFYLSDKENADMVTIYTDPTCGFCRKIHENIEKYNELGISIAYIPFPRGDEGTRPYEELKQVWCSNDRKESLNLAKHDKANQIKSNIQNDCVATVRKGVETGHKLQVRGTPSIYTENGYNIPGFVEPEKLREVIDQTK